MVVEEEAQVQRLHLEQMLVRYDCARSLCAEN